MGLNFEYSKDSSEFIAKEQSYVCVGGADIGGWKITKKYQT